MGRWGDVAGRGVGGEAIGWTEAKKDWGGECLLRPVGRGVGAGKTGGAAVVGGVRAGCEMWAGGAWWGEGRWT